MGRKARLKRERRNEAHLGDHKRQIRRRLAAAGLAPTLLEGPTEERKVSDALLELVQPYVRAMDSHEHTQPRLDQLVSFGALAWNASLLPASDAVVADGLATLGLGEEDLEIARDLIASLSERRRRLFPDDRRLIMSTAVTLTPSGDLRVSAAHAPIRDSAPLGE